MGVRALNGDVADDVAVYREVRLRALSADPTAFGSNLAREAAFSDAVWRSRLNGFLDRPGQVFIDETTAPNGVVGIGLTEDPTDAMLWGMWVTPEARGTGVGRRLVDAAIGWARSRSVATVTLWVMNDNDAATRLYSSCGFDIQADASPGAPEGCEDELRMRHTISYAATP